MKNLFTLAFCVFQINAAIFAQDCKYAVNKEDKFSNTLTQEIEPVELCSIVKNPGMVKIKDISMILRTENGKKYFTLAYVMGGSGGVPIFAGNGQSKLILLLDGGTKVELNMSGLLSDSKAKNALKSATLTHFELSEDAYFKLKAHSITDVRASAMMNPFDFKVKEEVKTSFYFGCIR